jgi:hypothetical protein
MNEKDKVAIVNALMSVIQTTIIVFVLVIVFGLELKPGMTIFLFVTSYTQFSLLYFIFKK